MRTPYKIKGAFIRCYSYSTLFWTKEDILYLERGGEPKCDSYGNLVLPSSPAWNDAKEIKL